MKLNVLTTTLASLLFASNVLCLAQIDETPLARYCRLVARVGYDGPGVATLLSNWEKADSTDINMLLGQFNYWYAHSERDTLIKKYESKYLGAKPVMSLKDTAGRKVNYFQVPVYDPQQFGKAVNYIDRAVNANNTRLDLAIAKVMALASYEAESPDLTLQYALKLVNRNFSKGNLWYDAGEQLEKGDFDREIQRLCHALFTAGAPKTYEAFRIISEAMLKKDSKNVLFLNNEGAYYLACKKDLKASRKYFQKVLKLSPDDATAKTNMEIIARMEAASKKK